MAHYVKAIPKERFQVFTLSKHPLTHTHLDEVEWYADLDEKVIGAIIRDLTDDDWNYVILGRDERGQFRWINGGVQFDQIAAARNELNEKLIEYAKDRTVVYPQHDQVKKKNEIFKINRRRVDLNPLFLAVRDGKGHSPARKLIEEVAYAFIDLDGNFIEQFQTTGFNTRLWELYLYAYFHEEGFLILDDHSSPDFHLRKWTDVFVEATTVNASPDFDIKNEPMTHAEVNALMHDYMPIKFGSALHTKLTKEYWNLPHVAGNPLILAVHDFHKPASMTWSHSGLMPYLYGTRIRHIFDHHGTLIPVPEAVHTHKYGSKEIPSGFFFQPGAENISAVLFSNSATVPKFNRLGLLADFGNEDIKMVRVGLCYDHDPNATTPKRFSQEIERGKCHEAWGEGVSLLHNPRALHPVDFDLFPSAAHIFMEDGVIKSYMPEFFPYSSLTSVMVVRDK